jgi:hypothetical protein
MNTQIEKLKSDINDRLFSLDDQEESLEKLTEKLKILDDGIMQLNEIIDKNPFTSEKEEIYLFKTAKPEILARRIEEVMRYNLTVNTPINTDESKIKYFEDELKARRSFFRMNNFHYQYFKNGLTDLDHLYFLRGNGQLIVPVAEFSDTDKELSTPMTYLFAKFIAYEHLQYYILEQIARLKYPESQQSKLSTQPNDLKWTGDSVNIVELAYGVWLTGQMNNGNASLNQIVRWLESSLDISIGIIQRRFNEIERRKRLSPTKFIDQMKEAILKKISSGNS